MKLRFTRKGFFSRGVSDLLEWVISIFMILFTGGIWLLKENSFVLNYNSYIRLIVYAMLFLWIYLSAKSRNKIDRGYLVWIIVCIFCLIMTLYSSWGFMKYAILRFYIPVILGLLIGWLVPIEKLWHLIDKFIWIMLAVAVESLVFWVFGTVLNILKSTRYVYYQWDDIHSALNYFNLYYEPTWGKQTLTLLDIVLDRNSAIFAEPPMYGFLLCVAYSFYRMKSNQKIGTKIIFIATILSTIGTTAIIYLMIFEVLAFGLKKGKSNTAEFLKFFLFIVIGIIAALVIFDLIESKLLTGSGSVRSDHLRVCLELFQTTFPLGCGIGNTNAFRQLEVYRQGMSVGLPALFAQGGAASIIIFSYPLVKLLVASIKEKKHVVIAFIVAFLWTNICTSVQFNSPISWFIVCYAARGTSAFTHAENNLQRNFTGKYPDGQSN